MKACGGDVAALIAQPYDHGNFADNRCASQEFWASVRQFCDKRGIVLILTMYAPVSGWIFKAQTTTTDSRRI